ncbi:MAG: hypothetical protein GY907_07160 [Bacteroidetes bacterium]|nr:hypothetical protein [Bacteroidota bacterium]
MLINFLEKWPEWTVWNKENNEGLEFEYQGPNGGLGAIQIWKGSRITGRITIIRSLVDKELQYQFDIDGDKFPMLGTIVLDTAEGGYSIIRERSKSCF